MELDVQYQELQPISFNYDQLKVELANKLTFYKGLSYSEDEIRTAKADRATLNKLREAIENRRKEVKKEYLKPCEAFETKIKEIVAMIDEPILLIDGQVKAFENKVKEEKRAEITAIYETNVGDLKDLLPLFKIWDEKWLNATASIKSVTDTITAKIESARSDLDVITGLKSEFELQIKDAYLRELNLSVALQEKTRLEEQKAKLEAYKKAQPGATGGTGGTIHKAEETPPEAKSAPVGAEELIQMDFRVYATAEQLTKLKNFLKENQIRYGKAE